MPRKNSQTRKDTAPPAQDTPPPIRVRGARTHNLKNITCSIPRGALTVVTGVSGSGKSSLAFDTLFAEGQRRYVESLSTYARQFLDRMPRPDVDDIDHIPPAIALEQKNSVKNARSTIGTATEINDYMRLLFAKTGRTFCPDCDIEAERDTPQSAAGVLEARGWPSGTRLFVLAPQRLENPAMFRAVVDEMRREGYTRLWIGEKDTGGMLDTTEPGAAERLPEKLAEFALVTDRLVWRGEDDDRRRLVAAVEQAFRVGRGRAVLRPADEGDDVALHETITCRSCGRAFRPLEPQLFSFYNPIGACKTCEGFGRVVGIDMEKVVPNPSLSLNEGCIAPWNTPTAREMYDYLREFPKLNIPWDTPFEKMTERQRRALVEGEGKWPGVRGFFRWLEERRYKVQNRIILARFRGFTPCGDCGGTRLVPEARWVRVSGRGIAELWAMSVRDLRVWFHETIRLTPREERTAELLLREIRSRLDYLVEVGLGYLTLDRQTRTLSGGESQRINLAAALGSALTETLYVLDEPTVGLHPRDTNRLIGVLRRLVELDNTVVVVEHDLDVIRGADHLIDLGPRAGEHGGEVLFQGPPAEAARNGRDAKDEKNPRDSKDGVDSRDSLTARWLRPFFASSARKATGAARYGAAPSIPETPVPTRARRRRPRGAISILGAAEHNLRNISVEIPLGVLTCVTGVSGSGKTTLIGRCLHANYRRMKGDTDTEPGRILRLEGLEQIGDMVFVDQTAIGRSARSNPATYLKAWDGIRELFASTREAQRLGIRTRDFSFNVEGGRCEVCKGTGTQVIDMQFLADVEVECESCGGRRFQERVLEVTFEGLNVNQALDLTIAEALRLFGEHSKVRRGLEPLNDVGLGYLRLGQSTATLSGGEAQRLKLAAHLAEASSQSRVMLLFDEPTTGLHPADIDTLLGVFTRLLDKGLSIVVIEHNLELIARADWVIDLGPEGGDGGGDVVATGPPEAVAQRNESYTGRFLRERLALR